MSIQKLCDCIKKRSYKLYSETNFVVYSLTDELFNLNKYENLKFESAQVSDHEIKINFKKSNTIFIFSNKVKEKIEDRKSFEKYGGFIYIIEPLTDDIATEILSKLKLS